MGTAPDSGHTVFCGREQLGSRPFVIPCHWTMTGFVDRINLYFCKYIHWGGKMKTERIQTKQRGVYIAILIAMAAGIVFAIRMAFQLDLLRDAYVLANSVLGIAVLVLGMALMANIAFSGNQDARLARVFTLMTGMDFLSIFCDVFTYEAYGLAEFSGSARVMYLLAYIIGSIYYVFLLRYILMLDNRKERSKGWLGVAGFILLYCLMMIADIFLGVLCKAEAGVVSFSDLGNTVGYLFWPILYILFFIFIFTSDLPAGEKWSLVSCLFIPGAVVFLPFLFSFAENGVWTLRLSCIEDFAMILSLYLAFFSVYQERGRLLLAKEAELVKSRLNTAILQANPHFVYNTLASIEYFCDTDPATAKDMLDDFTKYLRSNSANLTNRLMIPFREELENLNAYLRIELIRFQNLRVEYDIGAEDFSVPCLSVQPLVENAVRHGIGKRRGKAGTVTIKTAEDSDFWQIIIQDDGVGYTGTPQDGKAHIGIENVRQRLAILCGGTLTITGTEGQGTIAEMRIPKERKENYNESSLR